MSIDLADVRLALSHLPMTTMAEFDAVLATARRQREQDQVSAAGYKAAIMTALASGGVARVAATYDGYGDSGQFEDFTATLSDGTSIPLGEVAATVGTSNQEDGDAPQSITDAVETYCYDILEQLYDGYENNDGAFGEFVFDVAAGTVQLTHNDRFTDYDTTEHEL